MSPWLDELSFRYQLAGLITNYDGNPLGWLAHESTARGRG